VRRDYLMNDLRDRALRAAQEQAEQREREAAAAEVAEQQRREQLITEAEALCEQTLGIKAKFTADWVYRHYDDPTGYLQVGSMIEGVQVIYHPAGFNYPQAKLSHDLASLGAAIQARENTAKEEAERKVRLASVRAARTCNWCGEVTRYRWNGETVTETFPSAKDNAEALAHHKKWDCRKVPWWKGRSGWGTGTG
jgi:hypothetical protein